jgi:anti-anti-sigma factor
MTDELARIDSERRDGVSLVRLGGEIDLSNARIVGEHVLEAAGDLGDLIVDLGGLEYLDSSGLALLVRIAERCSLDQRRLCLVVPPGSPARRLLEVSGLANELPVAAGEEEALRLVGEAL